MVARGISMGEAIRAVRDPDGMNGFRLAPPPSRQEVAAEARRRALEQRFAERLAEPARGQPPELVRVRVRDIHFDRRYQTDDRYDDRRARKMAEEWDWDREVPVKLNIRPGDPDRIVWCPDGRHRVSAVGYRFGGDQTITAILHNVPYEAEAAMFANQDENRRRVSVALKFNAGKQAGNPIALEAQAVANRLGIVLGSKAGPRTIATQTYLELFNGKGAAATEEAISLILERWGGAAESMEAPFVKGMTWFVARNRDHSNYRTAILREVLSRLNVLTIQQKASEFRIAGEHKKIAAALVPLYNYKRRNTLPEWEIR